MGIQPSEVERMSPQQRYNVMAIAKAQRAIARNRMPEF